MKRYIAFLRAVNVGGRTIKMESLRALFQSMGYSNVETYIASGNVIFDAKENTHTLEKKIEKALETEYGFTVTTFIRDTAELATVAAFKPFPNHQGEIKGNHLYIGFLPETPTPEAIQKLLALQTAVDEFRVHQREFYWLCHEKISDSKISGNLIEKTLGLPMTMRNLNTVTKLSVKYPG